MSALVEIYSLNFIEQIVAGELHERIIPNALMLPTMLMLINTSTSLLRICEHHCQRVWSIDYDMFVYRNKFENIIKGKLSFQI